MIATRAQNTPSPNASTRNVGDMSLPISAKTAVTATIARPETPMNNRFATTRRV